MNETINVASTSSSTVIAGKSHNASKAATAGVIQDDGGRDVAESTNKEHSFSDSLSKVNEHTDTEKHDSSSNESGNSLPTTVEPTEKEANDDPLSLSAIIETVLNHKEQVSGEINLTGTQSAEKQLAPQAEVQLIPSHIVASAHDSMTALPTDTIVKGEVNASQLSSSMQSKSVLQNVVPEQTKNEVAKLTTKLNSTNHEKIDLTQLDLDNPDLSLEKKMYSGLSKHSTLTGLPTQQLNILNEIQGALSQRLETSPITSRIDTVAMPLVQAANSSPLNLQNALASMEISEPLNTPGWSKAMGKQIIWMANQNIKAAEIRLNPANLGPIEVRLDINDDQINVALSSRHAAVREAMEMTMPKLREMLENDGLNLADSNISHQSFAEQREQQAESKGSDKVGLHSPFVDQEGVTEKVINPKMTSTSMVDYFI